MQRLISGEPKQTNKQRTWKNFIESLKFDATSKGRDWQNTFRERHKAIRSFILNHAFFIGSLVHQTSNDPLNVSRHCVSFNFFIIIFEKLQQPPGKIWTRASLHAGKQRKRSPIRDTRGLGRFGWRPSPLQGRLRGRGKWVEFLNLFNLKIQKIHNSIFINKFAENFEERGRAFSSLIFVLN